MIRIKDAGGHGCSFASHLLTLDTMLHTPVVGADAAYAARKALAFVHNPQGRTLGPDNQFVSGYTTVDPYTPAVKYRRHTNGHKPVHHAVSV